ncbi:MAG: VanZ family protein [Gammaproteobacteria bacterium]|nr:VanZ family protein [Gammaproteobacteria bacterium]
MRAAQIASTAPAAPFSERLATVDTSPIRHRIITLMQVYTYLLILVLTLSPFDFGLPRRIWISGLDGTAEIVVNVLLFLPMGFLYGLRGRGPRLLLRAALYGLAASLFIETAQIFLPQRMSSISDLSANAMGTALGALLATRTRGLFSARLPDRLVLELPSMNILYLLIPLFWLQGTGNIKQHGHLLPTILLGLAGAVVLGGLWRYRIGPHAHLQRRWVPLIAMLWFVLASGPFLLRAQLHRTSPAAHEALIVLGMIAPMVGLFAFLVAVVPGRGWRQGLRFEPLILRTVFILFVCYCLAESLLPVADLTRSWFGVLTWPTFDFDRGQSMALASDIAALSVLGYISSAMLSRRWNAPLANLIASLIVCLAVATICELLEGHHVSRHASALRVLLGLAGVTLACQLYWTQLALVRALQPDRAAGLKQLA